MKESIQGTEIQGITFYTVVEIAQLLDITPQTVRAYIKEGRLKGKRIGRPILITQESLNAFLEPSFSDRGIGGDVN